MKRITPGQLFELLPEGVVFLMLDYDGTLVNLKPKPSLAVFSKSARNILSGIIKRKKAVVAIISGRSLKSVKSMVGVKGVIYSGNHGLEIGFPGFKTPVAKKKKKEVEEAARIFKKHFSSVNGMLVEDKGLTISVHYRRVKKSNDPLIKKDVKNIVSKQLNKNLLEIHHGKKVIEIRPKVAWDKGKAALWILKKYKEKYSKNIAPVFIGDDVTDEPAFSAVRKNGLAVRVGMKKGSRAQYVLKDVESVQKFLKMLYSRITDEY